jgi:hypothetical protein
VANCKVLSREMNHLLGTTLAPITLFRMAHPDKYKVKPYRYSVDLLEEFIDKHVQLASKVHIPQGIEAFTYPNRPEETALYKLLGLTLASNESALLEGFFEDLPMEHAALGWERHIIGHSLAEFFRASMHVKEKQPVIDRLLGLPQIRTYYFETFVDYKHGLKVYGKAIERMLIPTRGDSFTALRRLLQGADYQQTASAIFGHLILHQFAWLSKNRLLERRCVQVLNAIELDRYLDANGWMFPYVTVRYKVARLIMSRNSVPNADLDIDEWLDFLGGLFRNADPGNRSFGAVILADVLVLLGKRKEVQRLMNALPNDMIGCIANQPVYIRAALYRALCNEATDAHLQPIVDSEYVLGEGETAYHRLMMDAALKLFSRQSLLGAELPLLVAQTGFSRFLKKI